MKKAISGACASGGACSADCSAAGCGGWCTQRTHALRTGDPAVAVSVFCVQQFIPAARLFYAVFRAIRRRGGKALRLPPAAGSAFLLGLLGGYPAGAQAAGTLYARGELSGANAERALAVCNQSGPSFIFGVLGGAVFKSAAAGAFLYAVQIVSAVLVCRLTAKKQYAPAKAVAKPPQPESFAAAFSESVRRAGMSAIQICMFVTVFSVLSRYFLLAAGRFLPSEALPLFLGTLELSAGCAALADCALALQWKLCIAAALLSFGGVSVLAQSRAAVQEHGLSGKRLLPCKALQAALSCTLAQSPHRCCTRKAGPPPPFPVRKARKRRERRLCCCAR